MEQLNLADVTFAKLREIGYDETILRAVETENFESLRGNEILRDKKMAELLLYACINSRDPRMYPIYAYLQADVQAQLLAETHITNNILQNAPEVIKDTPLAGDKVAILNNISSNPEIVAYMSDKLIEDKQFIVEVTQQSPEALNEIIDKHSVEYIINNNPELSNNYDFFKQAAKHDKEIIKDAIENHDKLGEEAIKGIKDAAIENAKEDVMNAFSEEEKEQKTVKRSIDFISKEDKDPLVEARAIAHAIAKKENVAIEDVEEIFNMAEILNIALKKAMENPEYVVTEQDLKGLVNHKALRDVLNKSPLKDDEKWLAKVKQQEKFASKVRKIAKKNKEKVQQQTKANEGQQQENTAERQVNVAVISGNLNQGLEIFDAQGSVAREQVELTP